MKDDYRKLAREALATRDSMRPLWAELARMIRPSLADVARGLQRDPEEQAYEVSSTASVALSVLSGSCTMLVTPIGSPWMKLVSPSIGKKNPPGELWYQFASEVMLAHLARSNFYTEKQAADLNVCLFGTGLLLNEERRGREGLRFVSVPVGSFGLMQDEYGEVDTVCRELTMTPLQAVERFGFDKLPQEVQEAYRDPERRRKKECAFMHLVTPRDGYTRGNGGLTPPQEMEFASVFVYKGADDPIVEESGYAEFPYMVMRFARVDSSVWGYPPALSALDDIRSELTNERVLDMLAELAAFPRTAVPASMFGEVDYRAGHETYYSNEGVDSGVPQEWGSQGRMEGILERQQEKRKKIDCAFHKQFLQVVNGVEREMTAFEVGARQDEQVLSFSNFYTMMYYALNRFAERLFAVLYRQGAFRDSGYPEPPDLRVPEPDGGEGFALRAPMVQFSSRLSMAIERAQQQGMTQAVRIAAAYQSVFQDPQAFDCINPDVLVRDLFLSHGAPAKTLRSAEEVRRIREQRGLERQAQLALTAAQAGNEYAGAAQKLGATAPLG